VAELARPSEERVNASASAHCSSDAAVQDVGVAQEAAAAMAMRARSSRRRCDERGAGIMSGCNWWSPCACMLSSSGALACAASRHLLRPKVDGLMTTRPRAGRRPGAVRRQPPPRSDPETWQNRAAVSKALADRLPQVRRQALRNIELALSLVPTA